MTGVLVAEAELDAALDRLALWAVAESRAFALQARALVEVAEAARRVDDGRGHDCTSEFVPLHVAGTLTVQQGTAVQRLEQARHLVVLLPRTWRALDEGWLRVQAARVLVEETLPLTPAQCAQVEEQVLAWAPDRTAGEVRRKVRRVLARMRDAAQAEQARQRAMDQRRVSVTALPDGMAGIWAVLPAGAAQGFLTSLRALAERVKTDGDGRTAAQREADVLAALPALVLDGLTAAPQAVRGWLAAAGFRPGGRRPDTTATVVVPIGTALGSSQEPAELVGHGPVTAQHARELLETATVRLAAVDPSTGRLVALSSHTWQPDAADPASAGSGGAAGTTARTGLTAWLREQLDQPLAPPADEPGYRPSAGLRRFLDTRDPRCVGPGCTVPAGRCDAEHRVPWPHGPTGPGNLAPVSRRCHRAKQAGWSYRREPDGTTTWTAPGGRTHRVPPQDVWW